MTLKNMFFVGRDVFPRFCEYDNIVLMTLEGY